MSQRIWTLALTSVAFFMVALDALVVITALPAIHHDIGGSISTLEWTVNAFTLTYAAGIITAAALGDRFGRRLIFVTGLAVFTLSSSACAIAPSAELLIAARAVQGLGAAMVMPVSLTILTTAFSAERRGAIVGIWGGIGGLAVAAGPLVGGAITEGLSWHWIFWVNAPIGVATVLLSLVRLPESRGPATRLDLVAAALIGGGAVAVVWGLIRAGDEGWTSATALATLALGLAMIAAFVVWEARATEPMLPVHLFRNRFASCRGRRRPSSSRPRRVYCRTGSAGGVCWCWACCSRAPGCCGSRRWRPRASSTVSLCCRSLWPASASRWRCRSLRRWSSARLSRTRWARPRA